MRSSSAHRTTLARATHTIHCPGASGVVPKATAQWLGELSRWCLVIAIAALGVKTSFRQLAELGWQPVVMIVGETLFIAAVVLGGVLLTR